MSHGSTRCARGCYSVIVARHGSVTALSGGKSSTLFGRANSDMMSLPKAADFPIWRVRLHPHAALTLIFHATAPRPICYVLSMA